jgi:hypothetical protein
LIDFAEKYLNYPLHFAFMLYLLNYHKYHHHLKFIFGKPNRIFAGGGGYLRLLKDHDFENADKCRQLLLLSKRVGILAIFGGFVFTKVS